MTCLLCFLAWFHANSRKVYICQGGGASFPTPSHGKFRRAAALEAVLLGRLGRFDVAPMQTLGL